MVLTRMADVLLHAYTHIYMYTILRLNGNSAIATNLEIEHLNQFLCKHISCCYVYFFIILSIDMFTLNNFKCCIFFFQKKYWWQLSKELINTSSLPSIHLFILQHRILHQGRGKAVTLIGLFCHPIFPGKSVTVLYMYC